MIKPWMIWAIACVFALCSPSALWGLQEEDAAKETISEVDLALKKQLSSPRATMELFLEAMEEGDLEQASLCLDLSELDQATADVKGKTYAEKLYGVLTALWDQRTWKISANSDYDPPFQLSEILTDYLEPKEWADARAIQIIPDRNGIWRFSKSTLTAVEDELWDRWGDGGKSLVGDWSTTFPIWLERQFPETLRKKHFLLKDYQWISLILLTIIGFLVGHIARVLLNWLTSIWFRIVHARVEEQPRKKLWFPASLIVNALTWYFGAKMIDLPAEFLSALLIVLKFFAVVVSVWTAFRAITVLKSFLLMRAASTVSRYDDSLVPIICSLLKLASVLLGVILFVDVFDLDWRTVIGGFGVGGIALAIASKDVIGNFFGSITVLADRPFEIGDSVEIDGKVEGTVESVGMRSSRIRTYHNSQVIVPNSLLTTAVVDNLGRRQMRRFKTTLHLDFNTSVAKIDAFCAGVRQIIKNNPYTRPENNYVFLNDFHDSSIGIMMYAFFICDSWETELRERHCILRDTLKLAEELGVEFAFPTRTLHVPKPSDGNSDLPDTLEGIGDLGRSIADRIQQERK